MNTGFWAGLVGQEDEDTEDIKDTEEFGCESCNRRISEEEYYEHGGLCWRCRSASTQRDFSLPPGFSKM